MHYVTSLSTYLLRFANNTNKKFNIRTSKYNSNMSKLSFNSVKYNI